MSCDSVTVSHPHESEIFLKPHIHIYSFLHELASPVHKTSESAHLNPIFLKPLSRVAQGPVHTNRLGKQICDFRVRVDIGLQLKKKDNRKQRTKKLTTPENTITYHNALCLSPQILHKHSISQSIIYFDTLRRGPRKLFQNTNVYK